LDLLAETEEGMQVTVGGMIETIKKIYTKKTGAEMAFISIGDEKGVSIECVIFPKVFDLYKEILSRDGIVVIEGKLDMKNEKPVIIVNTIKKPQKLV
jgi:DNA polymerase-3 subunit alpha